MHVCVCVFVCVFVCLFVCLFVCVCVCVCVSMPGPLTLMFHLSSCTLIFLLHSFIHSFIHSFFVALLFCVVAQVLSQNRWERRNFSLDYYRIAQYSCCDILLNYKDELLASEGLMQRVLTTLQSAFDRVRDSNPRNEMDFQALVKLRRTRRALLAHQRAHVPDP